MHKSVVEMLRKPVVRKELPVEGDSSDAMRVMARVEADAKKTAIEQLQPRIDAAEALAKAAEAERDKFKAQNETLQKQIADMHAMHEQMQVKILTETDAKDKANASFNAECTRAASLSVQVSELTGRLTELGKHNATLQSGIHGITTEIGKRKPETRTIPKVPDFNFEVVSRDQNGAIKSISIKPK